MAKMKIKTTRRNSTWGIQRQDSRGRWNLVVGEGGVLVLPTRRIARTITREYRNLGIKNIRVVMLAPKM
jgi:hypothetical protein